MKKIFAYAIAAIVAAATVSSCDLNLFPHGSLAYDEEGALFTNEKELGYFQNGLYASFRSNFYGEYALTEELMMDGFNATGDYGNNYGAIHRIDESFNPSDYNIRDFWAARYSNIKDYNVFIKGVESLPAEYASLGKAAQLVKGEAYFFRAFAYLDLIRHFAPEYNAATAKTDLGVPLVLVYDQTEKPSRASVKAVYDQIKADLDSAAFNLAAVPGKVASGSVTIDAVNALYARYYLDVKQYNKAYEKAVEVILSDAGYALSSTLADFKKEYYNDNGKEAIMQLYASKTENGSGTNNLFTFMANDSEHGDYFNSPYYIPSKKLLDLYDATDLRLQCWFTKGANAFTGKTYPVKLVSEFYTKKFYIFTKYLGNPDLTSSNVLNGRQHVKPILIGEMYLIAAEACFRNNDVESATEILRTLQSQRGAKPCTLANEELLQNEWFKETVGEGLRLSTIRRFGQGFNGRAGQTEAVAATVLMNGPDYETRAIAGTDYHLVWPIPSNEIQTNPNIAKEQNPGY